MWRSIVGLQLWILCGSLRIGDALMPPSLVRGSNSRFPSFLLTTVTPVSTTSDDKTIKLSDQEEQILFGDYEEDKSSALHLRKKDMFGNILPDKDHANPKRSTLDHASDPMINKLHTIRESIQSCPELWGELATTCPNLRAVFDEHLSDAKIDQTFAEFHQSVQRSAAVFQSQFALKKGQHVAVLGENSATWLMIDQGIQLAGGISAVRGADAPVSELRYIYQHSDSAGIVVLQGPKLLQKLMKDDDGTEKSSHPLGLHNKQYGPVKTVLLMHREKKTDAEIAKWAAELKVNIYVFPDLLQSAAAATLTPVPIALTDVATIVYTSGTTGHPKGVQLTHGNLLHQTGHRLAPSRPYEATEPLPGETMVSILPVWHITERTFELWMAARGCSIVYSSIPYFKKDLEKHRPQWMVLVPRVLEKIAKGVQDKFASGSIAVRVLSKFFTQIGQRYRKCQKIVRGLVTAPTSGVDELMARVMLALLTPFQLLGNKLVWSKVQQGFGGRVKVIISGGSALAGALETFYETAGLPVCVGYGLTECSPLISFRRLDCNLVTAGCAGTACTATEFRIVDPASAVNADAPRPSLPTGEAGLILAKGPQVMKGYYKNPEATAKAIDTFGWFDTGDLGRVNPATGDLILTGRAKDTIVLSNGENIEPVPLEDAILGSSAVVDQVMLTGQDGRSLLAITVLNPLELVNAGVVDRAKAEAWQAAMEKVSDPKCSVEDFQANQPLLVQASAELRSNAAVVKLVGDVVKGATSSGNGFRKWEKVNDVYVTVEPFAMVNGQLTQSYKVKRPQVMERYEKELSLRIV
jgi:long-chain acyl-CoA synthetase